MLFSAARPLPEKQKKTMQKSKSVSFRTYAKINLSLDVTGVRDNGYHDVEMVMQGIDLYDEMTVRIFPAEEHKITLKTDKYYIPTDERNTAYKGAQLMLARYEGAPVEIRMDIKKNIPVAAGLAGGSSNGAGAILAANRLLGLGLDLKELCGIGAKVGADVPFSIMVMAKLQQQFGISGGMTCALATGTGEILTPKPARSLWAVLAKVPAGVSTKMVYQELDRLSGYPHPDTSGVLAAAAAGDLQGLKASMGNVLEQVTLKKFPEVAALKGQMQAVGGAGAPVMMSGSGPTVYGLFSSEAEARRAGQKLAEAVAGQRTEIFCVKTL